MKRVWFFCLGLLFSSASMAKDAEAIAFVRELHFVETSLVNHVRNKLFDDLKRQLPRISSRLSQLHWTSSIGAPTSVRCVAAMSAIYGLVQTWQRSPNNLEAANRDLKAWSEHMPKCEDGVGIRQMPSQRLR